MNKTNIEWVRNPDGSQGYTLNIITGCLNIQDGLCKGGGFPCYAYKLANGRLKPLYLANIHRIPFVPGIPAAKILDPFYPRFWEERLKKPYNPIMPVGIFVCDMGELFGDWIPGEWQKQIFQVIKERPQHRFYLLTKQPQNLIKFSPFPENCWVGVTVTNRSMLCEAAYRLDEIQAKIKFVSIEPFLRWERMMRSDLENILGAFNWLVIGACTGSHDELWELCKRYPELTIMSERDSLRRLKWTAQPSIGWLREIVEAADKVGVKVFLKDNLRGLLPKEPPFYTKCCAEVNGKDPCYEEPCLSDNLVDECSKAPNFWMLRQEIPNV